MISDILFTIVPQELNSIPARDTEVTVHSVDDLRCLCNIFDDPHLSSVRATVVDVGSYFYFQNCTLDPYEYICILPVNKTGRWILEKPDSQLIDQSDQSDQSAVLNYINCKNALKKALHMINHFQHLQGSF